MTTPEKYNKMITGIISGLLLPFLTCLIIFLFSHGNRDLHLWLKKIHDAGIITHIITLSVFPNIIIFFIFNHFDMLRAARGVLGVTIVWAVFVLGGKILL